MGLIGTGRYSLVILAATIAYGQASVGTPPTDPSAVFPAMSAGDKVRYNLVHAVHPFDFVQTALGSGLAQWRNSPHEWGHGWDGYGRRYGSRFGQLLVRRTVTMATHVIDGEDPRRIRSERAGFWPRAKDAVKYTFVANRDDGSRGFAYGRVIGHYAGGLVSRSWHPERLHTFPSGIWAGSTSLGIETGVSVLNEFMPDILRKLHLRDK